MDQQNNQVPAPKPRREFRNLMTTGEKIAGWIYLPVHIVVLPLLLPAILYWLTRGNVPDGAMVNVWYYMIGLVFLLAAQFRFFRENYHVFTHSLRNVLLTMAIGYFILLACNYALLLITQLFGGLPTSPNDEAVNELLKVDMRRMVAAAVIMAPIVEEALFRGMIFGSLRGKHRFWAYALSMVLFALCHVWQYAVVAQSFQPLLSAFAYLPIGFVLAFCYDRTGSIWTPIFFHMFYNALALSMR